MKHVCLCLVAMFLITEASAQILKRNLSTCMSITEEIDSVRNSFDVLLGTFKKDHNFSDKYGDEYSSEFEICGQPGVLEVMPDKTNFIFNYSDEKYVGTADDFQRC